MTKGILVLHFASVPPLKSQKARMKGEGHWMDLWVRESQYGEAVSNESSREEVRERAWKRHLVIDCYTKT